jgi:TPR repeat protein
LYRLAADAGHPRALNNLAFETKQSNRSEATRLFRIAADSGCGAALDNMSQFSED